jgi:hypothetical protein
MTILVIYARVAYSEALQAFLFVWITRLLFRLMDRPNARDAAWAGFAVGWLITTKAVNVLAIGVAALYLGWTLRRDLRQLLRVVGAAALTCLPWAALTMIINHIKTGSAFDTGYTTAGGAPVFSGQFYPAVVGFFLSPGKSIFAFSPVLILGLLGARTYWRTRRAHAGLVLGIVLAVLLPHLKFPAWPGGWVWGPRYAVSVTPLMLLPAGPWLDEKLGRGLSRVGAGALGLLGVVGAWVQAAGCFFFWDFYIRMVLALRGTMDEALLYISTVFIPQFSPIVMHSWMAWHKLLGDKKFPANPPFFTVVDKFGGANLDGHWAGLRFDFWFLQWFGPSGSPRWGAGVLTILLAGAVWSAAGLLRGARAPEERMVAAQARHAG